MESVYEGPYRYSNVYRLDHSDYTAIDRFDLMKDEFDWNRPVQFRITGHSKDRQPISSYLFSGGDLNRGIQINPNAGAAIKMTNNGGIKFFKQIF